MRDSSYLAMNHRALMERAVAFGELHHRNHREGSIHSRSKVYSLESSTLIINLFCKSSPVRNDYHCKSIASFHYEKQFRLLPDPLRSGSTDVHTGLAWSLTLFIWQIHTHFELMPLSALTRFVLVYGPSAGMFDGSSLQLLVLLSFRASRAEVE